MRWLRLVGSIIALVGALLFYAKTILDWIGRLDLVLSHRTEIGGALEYVLAPPWWLPWCVLLSGLALIWADTQRRAKAPGAAPADIARERKLTRSSAAVKATKRLSPSDKDRLANALSDLSKLFDDRVWMPTHITVHNVLSAANDYSKPISPNIQQYRDQLIKLSEAARDYRDKFAETQKKWKYYSLQISYIMEDDSDSDHGERGFEDAINGFIADFDKWSKIVNIEDRSSRELLNYSQNHFNESLSRFANWQVYCGRRLDTINMALERRDHRVLL